MCQKKRSLPSNLEGELFRLREVFTTVAGGEDGMSLSERGYDIGSAPGWGLLDECQDTGEGVIAMNEDKDDGEFLKVQRNRAFVCSSRLTKSIQCLVYLIWQLFWIRLPR